MIKADNAVIMAAGMSTRLAPISHDCPKPLLKVKGEILIERQIRQLRESGIREIIIVTGYMKEKYEYLKDKFNVILVHNPDFSVRNNHSSLYVVKDYLRNTYISCGDLYFADNSFACEVEKPYYALNYSEGDTDEWCVSMDEGRITGVNIGGKDSWFMQGEAFWDNEFSEKMKPLLEEAMKDETALGEFWEDLYIKNIENMTLYGKCMERGHITELDDVNDLRAFDPIFRTKSNSPTMEAIAFLLKTQESELTDFKTVKDNGRAVGVTLTYNGNRYRYCYGSHQIDRI